MGLRFNLSVANLLAYIIEPGGSVPQVRDTDFTKKATHLFLKQLHTNFFSSPQQESIFRQKARRAAEIHDTLDGINGKGTLDGLLMELKCFLRDRPWTALIIPAGDDVDNFLCGRMFLRYLVNIRCDDPGLILQLEDPPDDQFMLLDVFSAFNTALAESTNWPGILIWSPGGDSAFLPFGTYRRSDIEERAHWIISHLATSVGVDLALLKSQYIHSYPEVYQSMQSKLSLLQLSDLHLGSKYAKRRLPRVQQLIRNVIDELGDSAKIVPVVTGDLMDTPSDDHLDYVRSFLDFLYGLGVEDPSIVLGNHDVRKDGYLLDSYRTAIRLPQLPVRWFDDEEVGLLCINSVTNGRLARGFVGEGQFMDLGSEIEREDSRAHYQLVAALHHHPVPVDIPEWYARPFYERVFGSLFEKTEDLEDASAFLQFAEARHVALIIHGHKHIPHATNTANDIPVFGCGSTVGKVSTNDGSTYMSLNVLTIDSHSKRIVGRLLAERIPGGGLVEQRRHELVVRA